jgi:hypothetical protein
MRAERSFIERYERDSSSIAAIRPDGSIGWVNPAWLAFARANGGANATIDVGANYFAGISGEVREPFEAAVAECLATGVPFEQDYECSSPSAHRRYRLRMLPVSDQVILLVHHLIASAAHDRPAEPPDEERYRDDRGLIAQCSNCRRTRAFPGGAWHWVPAWIERRPEHVAYVLCALCRTFCWPTRVRSG